MKKIIWLTAVVIMLSVPAFGIELRTAAQEASPKFFIKDGKMVGICVDALRAIEKTDSDIRFVGDQKFNPLKRIEFLMETERLDCFAGFVKNKKRMAKYIFVDIPIYYVSNVLTVRKDDDVVINSLEDIKKLKDSTVLSSYEVAQAKKLKREGFNVDDGGRTPAANIKKLVAGRGRFIYLSETSTRQAVKDLGYQDRVKILPARFEKSGRYIAFSKNTPKSVVEKVARALEILRDSGELDRIFAKYVN